MISYQLALSDETEQISNDFAAMSQNQTFYQQNHIAPDTLHSLSAWSLFDARMNRALIFSSLMVAVYGASKVPAAIGHIAGLGRSVYRRCAGCFSSNSPEVEAAIRGRESEKQHRDRLQKKADDIVIELKDVLGELGDEQKNIILKSFFDSEDEPVTAADIESLNESEEENELGELQSVRVITV